MFLYFLHLLTVLSTTFPCMWMTQTFCRIGLHWSHRTWYTFSHSLLGGLAAEHSPPPTPPSVKEAGITRRIRRSDTLQDIGESDILQDMAVRRV